MAKLPAITPFPWSGSITSEDLRAVLRGVTPGTYRTMDLYPRYRAWASECGKAVQTAKTLGEAIRRSGIERLGSSHGHVAVWAITEDWTR